jgi:hypothetical protein
MCRNIKPLFNFEPPATEDEIAAAALQFVRKISGAARPSQVNQAAFDTAIAEIAASAQKLLTSMQTTAPPRSREIEEAKARARLAKRFGARA